MLSTSGSLLERLRNPNEQEAWNQFAGLYTPLLYYWLRRLGLSQQDAADLIQDVFLVLVTKLPHFQYQRDGTFRGWLRTLTLNKHRELQRRKKLPIAEHFDEVAAQDSRPAIFTSFPQKDDPVAAAGGEEPAVGAVRQAGDLPLVAGERVQVSAGFGVPHV